MNGNILLLKENKYGSKTYGFITGEDGKEYFFHKSSIINCTIFQLEEGDTVEFVPNIKYNENRNRATNVRKKYSSIGDTVTNDVNPGINPNVNLDKFNDDEKNIIIALGEVLYITNGGKELTVAGSRYRYVLAKPTRDFTVMFNMTREIPIVFSDYVSFEPRSLDVASVVAKIVQSKLRLDRSCQILISNDSNVEIKMLELLKDSNLNSIVIPFSYREILSGQTRHGRIIDRFRKYLFDADLFSTSKPIQNDVFFFGRRDFARDIADKCKQASLSGIFGLRRSGKTSMLLAVKRILENEEYPVVFIPCQSELTALNWKDALFQIAKDIKEVLHCSDYLGHCKADYQGNTANISFMEDLNVFLEAQSKPVTLMFDEIESITFDVVSSGPYWREGDSYVQFWNIIRGYCTQHPSRLSILVAGTNPMINEVPAIGQDNISNPMFGQLSASNQGAYLKPFDIDSTKVMINTLGGYMGINFTDSIATALTNDCGGHPYLIRLLCGQINKYIREQKKNKPVTVSKGIYEKARSEFETSNDAEGFYLMILNILQSCYIKEYNALKILATEGDSQLSQTLGNTELLHLYGYGLIENNAGNLAIRFDTIERFLQGKYRFERKGLSIEDQKLEINVRFDTAEQKLRSIIKDTMRTILGENEAKKVFFAAMQDSPAVSSSAITQAKEMTYKQLFDPTVNHGCFFSVLITVINKNYSLFSKVFECTKTDTISKLRELNRARQLPAHSAPDDAEKWNSEDFESFRSAMTWLEAVLDNYD